MARPLIARALGALLLSLLVACGGGGGGDDALLEGELEPVDFSGRWEIRENSEVYESYSPACRPGGSTALHTFNVSQDGNIVTIGTSYGTFSALVNGNEIRWTGTFLNQKSNRWTTFHELVLTFEEGLPGQPDRVSGENSFEHFEDLGGPGLRLCRGWSLLSGVRTSN